MNEIVEAIKEMMDVWNRLMAEARAMLPDATPEELFRVVSEAMNRTPLGGSQPPAGGRKH